MKYRNWMQFIPASLIAYPWSIVHENQRATAGDWISLAAWDIGWLMVWWQINAGLVLQKAGRTADSEPEDIARASSRVRPYTDLNALESVSQVTQLRDLSPKAVTQLNQKREEKILDRRIQLWAHGVIYENAPMTQTFWCIGKNKPFSKPAYVAWIAFLLENRIIVPISAKNPNSSYEPNGRAGRHYIKALADGRMYIPFPTYETSEKSNAFLSAQVRKRLSGGGDQS